MFVKVCGIANESDALLAAGLGADAIGLIFAPSSRQVTKRVANDIVRRLPPEILSVGVFRNEARARVVELANTIGLRAVQLHGHESAEDTRWIAARVPNVIRAFAADDPALHRLEEYGPVQVLIDSATPGSGQTFDWTRLDAERIGRPFVLAGGLDPDNVAEAIHTVRPWGVDVASGVEAEPGRKDPVKVRRFIANAQAAFAELDTGARRPIRDETDGADDDLEEYADDWMTDEPSRSDTLPVFDWKDDPLWN